MLHNVSAIKNQSLFFGHFLSFRDNLTSLSRNILLLSNFKNLFFALKHVFLVKNHYSANFWLSCWSYDQERIKKKNSSHETSQTSAQCNFQWRIRICKNRGSKFETSNLHLLAFLECGVNFWGVAFPPQK